MRPNSKKGLICLGPCNCLLVVVVVWAAPLDSYAQDSQNHNSGSWQPPQISQPAAGATRNPGFPWPAHQAEVDPGVRTANYEKGLPDPVSLPEVTAELMPTNIEGAGFEFSDPSDEQGVEFSWAERLRQKFAGADVQKMFGSLAIVLGGYFGFVWVWRWISPGGLGGLPPEVLEIVGQTPFGPKKTLQLVRLGTKLLLLINGPEGTHPIGEITDSAEVDHITTICSGRGRRGAAGKKTVFKQLVEQIQDNSKGQPQPATVVAPVMHPQVIATPIIQQPVAPVSHSNGELERILKKLTEVVAQSKHQNEYEA